MNVAGITTRASRQLQQRAIPPHILQLLELCGSAERCGQADRLLFDKAAKKRLTYHLGGKRGLRLIEPWLNVYAVIGDDGAVLTVGHRSRNDFLKAGDHRASRNSMPLDRRRSRE